MKAYPILDEEHHSEVEWKGYEESYDSWAKDNALDIIDEHLHEQNPELKDSVKNIELTPDVEKALFRSVMDTLSYNSGESVDPKELLRNESIGEVINYFREKLGMGTDQKYVPENPNQMKLLGRVIIKGISENSHSPGRIFHDYYWDFKLKVSFS